ncbi:sigma 54-interacting transcriptional regulator [Sorangium sp. So ce1389]|uniref:sigma 54-interacting transcriptional regulator n=1 Tax=Sorangium sp. So ce1389 TaxID=3133336 RepID=UPI003F62CD92
MQGSWHQLETLTGIDTPAARGASVGPRRLRFTLLYHPDLRRVGARATAATVPGYAVPLSRLEPDFAQPRSRERAPLCDPHVSRKPHLVAWGVDDSLTITPAGRGQLSVDGEPVDETRRFPAEALRAGLLLRLSRSIAILVHIATSVSRAPRHDLVGDSDALEEVLRSVARVADLQVPVLLRGETGVGKERVAQAIHQASPRAGRPWLAVNMAALAPTTAASELFGHAKGSFTGAHQRHAGLFERAHGGTLFLDEIGDMSMDVQAMLLRALETGTILPLGDSEQRAVDVRVIAATDVDLEQAVAQGRFRAPLLHRLQGYTITIPPLRQSREDIPRLLLHFLCEELAEVGELSRLEPPADGALPWFPRSLMMRLIRHPWPGNVRQLRNVARQLVISSRGADAIVVDESLERMLEQPRQTTHAPSDAPRPVEARGAEVTADEPEPRGQEREVDDDALLSALRQSNWSIGPAAAALGVSRATLYRLIERSPHVRKAADIPDDELKRCHDECAGDLEAMSARLRVSKRGLKLRLRELVVTRQGRER